MYKRLIFLFLDIFTNLQLNNIQEEIKNCVSCFGSRMGNVALRTCMVNFCREFLKVKFMGSQSSEVSGSCFVCYSRGSEMTEIVTFKAAHDDRGRLRAEISLYKNPVV